MMIARRRRGQEHIRIFDPDRPDDGPTPRPAGGTGGTFWWINGHPARVVLWPPSDERPADDAQLDPSGIWVTLRML